VPSYFRAFLAFARDRMRLSKGCEEKSLRNQFSTPFFRSLLAPVAVFVTIESLSYHPVGLNRDEKESVSSLCCIFFSFSLSIQIWLRGPLELREALQQPLHQLQVPVFRLQLVQLAKHLPLNLFQHQRRSEGQHALLEQLHLQQIPIHLRDLLHARLAMSERVQYLNRNLFGIRVETTFNLQHKASRLHLLQLRRGPHWQYRRLEREPVGC